MKQYITIIILLISTCFYLIVTSGSTPDNVTQSSFDSATQHYKNGNFQEAASSYQSLINQGQQSTAIYNNLALSHEALGELGKAILYYEKAAQLSPQPSEILSNLADLRQQTGSTGEMNTNSSKIITRSLQTLSPKWWTILGAMALILITTLTVTQLLRINHYRKRTWLSATPICLLIIGLSVTAIIFQKNETLNKALILNPDTPLRVSPIDSAESISSLPAGEHIKIEIETQPHGAYQLIKTNDGQLGWIKSEQYITITNS